MTQVLLTDQQIDASTSEEERLFIEAHPGSGKTTVAAERFGILRYGRASLGSRAIIAVSFTRSATSELYRRIRGRWGTNAITWPHGVMTIDRLVCDIVHHLLRIGNISWLGDHTTLEVLDDWRGHKGYRWLRPGGNYRRVVTLDHKAKVTTKGERVTAPGFGFGSRDDLHNHLGLSRCTHEDVRSVLRAALNIERLEGEVLAFLQSSISHLIVDEVFDANELDLALVELACRADIGVTLVGDPWQALYGFRGAKPDLVPSIITSHSFTSMPLSQSFRFESCAMKRISQDLRNAKPVNISTGDDHDVVLASTWDMLWSGPDYVLPLSFGRRTNQSDAAMIMFLDHIVCSRFVMRAIFLPEALVLLGIDSEAYDVGGPEVFGEVVQSLASDPTPDLANVLANVRIFSQGTGR